MEDSRDMFKLAIPVIRVFDVDRAETFYCAKLGFCKQWIYRPGGDDSRDAYLGLTRDGVCIHVSSFPGDGVAGAVTNFEIDDVDALFSEFKLGGVPILLEPTDQEWNAREMHVGDPDGNKLRFVQELIS